MQGYVPAHGTGDNGVLIVLEAAGKDEAASGIPVVGAAGQYLFSNLKRVDIDREGFRIHNVLSCQPPGNKLVKMPYERLAIDHCAPLLDETIADMAERCRQSERHFTILALGKTAFKRIMGYDDRHPVMREDYQCYIHRNEKYQAWVVAADHPSHLMQGKSSRLPILQFATRRALEVAEHGCTYDAPSYLCDPSPSTFAVWIQDYIRAWEADKDEIALAYDIETPYKSGKNEEEIAKEEDDDYTILRCSFAYRPGEAISIPWRAEYMAGLEELFSVDGLKVGWNSTIYDDPRITAQIPVRGSMVDGMLAWHVLNTSLPKGLGFVTPFYTQNAPMWKHLSDSQPAYYNAADSNYTIANFYGIKRDLIANNLWGVFQRHVVTLNYALNYMSGKGVLRDEPARAAAEAKLSTLLDGVETRMAAVVPNDARKVKVYKRVPKELKGLDGDALEARATELGLFRQDTMVPVRVCDRCGVVAPLASHTKSIGKKALKAGGVENPCLGAGQQPAEILVPLWTKRLEFKISNTSLQTYQKVLKHQAVLSRKDHKITFDANALTMLQKRYPEDPLYRIIGEHREIQKLLGTYIGVTGEGGRIRGGMPVGRDGRIHTIFTHNPSTLRLASQNPNLQNLPRPGKEDDLQSIIRNLIVAGPGCVFVARDFGGIEAVLAGYEAKSPGYIRLAKQDVHTFYTLYALYGLEDPRVSSADLPLLSWDDDKLFSHLAHFKALLKHDRNSLYKHLTHAINFGQGASGAQEKILKETQVLHETKLIARVMDIYRELFPEIPKWHHTIRMQAADDGYLRNAFGYVHRFNRVFSWKKEFGTWTRVLGDDAEAVLAFRPQSNAAGIIKEALLRLYNDRFEDAGQYLRLQVHDEVFSECPESYVDTLDDILKEEMEKPVPELPLPASWNMGAMLSIGTEGKSGPVWGRMK